MPTQQGGLTPRNDKVAWEKQSRSVDALVEVPAQQMPSLAELRPIKQHSIEVEGQRLPEVLVSGTSRSEVFKATNYAEQIDMGRFLIVEDEPYRGISIDATSSDPRAYPKHPILNAERAVVVFSTDLAFSEDLGGSTENLAILRAKGEGDYFETHVRFRSLPKASFVIISGEKVPFGSVSESSPKFDESMIAAKNYLIEKARRIRAEKK